MFTYLIWGVAYGFAAAMQPGPFQAYLITQTLRNGWRQTLPAVFAPLLSDGPIIALVLLMLSQIPAWWLQTLRFAGGAFVLYLAIGVLRAWRHVDASRSMNAPAQQSVLRAAFVNVLNPGPYLYWSLVMGPLLLSGWQEAPAYGISLLVGFYVTMLVSLAGILLLCAGAGKLGTKITRSMLGLSGVALMGFGLYQIWSGMAAWWQGG
jgi:threonine/homoserine/homoserine lactone efflux protein